MLILWVWFEGVLALFHSAIWTLAVVVTVLALIWSAEFHPLPTSWRNTAQEMHICFSTLPAFGYLILFYASQYLHLLHDWIAINREPFVGWSLITWIGLFFRLRVESTKSFKVSVTFLLFVTWYIVIHVLGAHGGGVGLR
jgi:hypothetical protein